LNSSIIKGSPARVIAYFQTVRRVFALFFSFFLQFLLEPVGVLAADAAGDFVGFPAFQLKRTPSSVLFDRMFSTLFAVHRVFPGQVLAL